MVESHRQRARLFLGVLWTLVLTVGALNAATLATTTIIDTVYRADGGPASGVVLISWPSFSTVDNESVASGTLSTTLGPQGALVVNLVPNVGATPAGTYYVVIYKLDDGTTSTENWLVGTTSPTTIAAVRTTPGSGTASQVASRQYVDGALAGKANDATVVHNTGSETIDGNKLFSASPTVPTPSLATDAVNKAYVDGTVAAAGSGSYVSKAGDTMSGPLTLPSEKNDLRRSVHDRIVNAVIATAISVAVALHDHLGFR
jgi:trimeric autotransporter adhesin